LHYLFIYSSIILVHVCFVLVFLQINNKKKFSSIFTFSSNNGILSNQFIIHSLLFLIPRTSRILHECLSHFTNKNTVMCKNETLQIHFGFVFFGQFVRISFINFHFLFFFHFILSSILYTIHHTNNILVLWATILYPSQSLVEVALWRLLFYGILCREKKSRLKIKKKRIIFLVFPNQIENWAKKANASEFSHQ
jgi:hypothetical protein